MNALLKADFIQYVDDYDYKLHISGNIADSSRIGKFVSDTKMKNHNRIAVIYLENSISRSSMKAEELPLLHKYMLITALGSLISGIPKNASTLLKDFVFRSNSLNSMLFQNKLFLPLSIVTTIQDLFSESPFFANAEILRRERCFLEIFVTGFFHIRLYSLAGLTPRE